MRLENGKQYWCGAYTILQSLIFNSQPYDAYDDDDDYDAFDDANDDS